jgi:group II intron reverse transcriptase/maturase
MGGAQTPKVMSPGLRKVVDRAWNEPEARFNSLAHLIDVTALERAYGRLRKDAGVGVDGITKDEYGQNLQANLRSLHERLKTGGYRHQPIRRIHIPKPGGKTRPIGVSTVEDKIVQDALREVLEAVFEQDFLECSFGFRPARSAHDAIRVLNRAVHSGEVSWIVEADIVSFFDSVDRKALLEMLRIRIADGALLRLVGKCLHVGVLDGAEYSEPDEGTVQGSVLSPLLANIFLHYVLDVWFEREVKPRLKGKAHLIRYADDVAMAFEREDDARRVLEVLAKRMGRYGLKLHPEKTRLVPFKRPSGDQRGGKGPASFDLLGFTLYWRRTLRGRWEMACKTRRASLRRAIASVYEWCRGHRHLSIKDQHAALARRIRGHFGYFAVNGNSRSLALFLRAAARAWYKWLGRRSNRSRLNWKRFSALLERLPLPQPRITIRIWGG